MNRVPVNERIKSDFRSVQLSEQGKADTSAIREVCLSLATIIAHKVPEGREQSTALTKLEEVMFHANAGISRHT